MAILRLLAVVPLVSLFAMPVFGQKISELGGWASRAKASKSKYFAVKSTFEADETAILAEHCDAAFEAIVRLFSRLPQRRGVSGPIDLYLVAGQGEFKDLLLSKFQHDIGNLLGYVNPVNTPPIIALCRDDQSVEVMKISLQNMVLRVVLRFHFPNMTAWCREGLGFFFEQGVMIDGALVLGEVNKRRVNQVLEARDNKKLVHLDHLFSVGFNEWRELRHRNEDELLNAEACTLVHFLIYSDDGRHEIEFFNFLAQINLQTDWRKAFAASFGDVDVATLEQQWLAYVRGLHATNYRETVLLMKFLAAGMTALHAEGEHPTTMAALKQKLEEKRFQYDPKLYGDNRVIMAADERSYVVPCAEDKPEMQFVLEPPKGSARSRTPYTITIEGMEPITLSAVWARQGKDWAYKIGAVAKKKPGARTPTRSR